VNVQNLHVYSGSFFRNAYIWSTEWQTGKATDRSDSNWFERRRPIRANSRYQIWYVVSNTVHLLNASSKSCHYWLLKRPWSNLLYIPSILRSMGSAPVGVQCPLTSSLGEFPGYWDWLWCSRLSPVLLSIAFAFAFSSRCFSFPLLHLPMNFIRVSSLRLMCLHPSVDPSLTQFTWVYRLLSGSGTRCCDPRGGAGVHAHEA